MNFLLALLLIVAPPAEAQTLSGGLPVTLDASTTYVDSCITTSPCTVSTVLTTQVCGPSNLGKYAIVSDLYSGSGTNTNEVMRCGLSGSSYYWRPQRVDYTTNQTISSSVMTLTCLVSSPTIFLNGALATNTTITLSSTNCWPGARFEIANNVTLGVFGLTVTGLAGSTNKVLGAGAHYTFEYDGTNWQFYQ